MGQALEMCKACETPRSCDICPDLHEWIMEHMEPMWISVKHMLPKMCEDGTSHAFLVTDGFLIHMAYFANGEWFFCESGEMKEPMFYCVTHWMPLPEPPEEDSHENA